MNLEKLRSVVRDCFGKHLYSSAIFFADKLVTVSGAAAADMYLLAQVSCTFFVDKAYFLCWWFATHEQIREGQSCIHVRVGIVTSASVEMNLGAVC